MNSTAVAPFGRDFFSPSTPLTVIGRGEIGGKCAGLARIRAALVERLHRDRLDGVEVAIPFLTVIATDVFEAFMERNRLWDAVARGGGDERIVQAFLNADLPAPAVGDLRALATQVRTPLAVRSSSLLEDRGERPFAGVYKTKMIPNNQIDADTRFRRLAEAIKLVWASTYFESARVYRAAAGVDESEERMGVIVQEVVGRRHGERFYPTVSGVARSFNYYASGHARPEDGFAQLALGLGKTIVDGGAAWSYSPAFPKAPLPVNDLGDLLRSTQTSFWAVNMGDAVYDPGRETEYLVRCELADAETDDTLRFVASTFDASANRLVAGTHAHGPRVVDMAPLLRYAQVAVNGMVEELLKACAAELGGPVEIEFAISIDSAGLLPARCGFLQVRAMAVPGEEVTVTGGDLAAATVVVAADHALGNGEEGGITDIVHLRRESFDVRRTPEMATTIGQVNGELVAAGRPYLLMGFGRWGTSDPWGGVPVEFAQISGARVIVEAQRPELRAELSQGSHFFHNLTALRVLFLSPSERGGRVDWEWLEAQPAAFETDLVRHVRLDQALTVRVDGRNGRGVVLRG